MTRNSTSFSSENQPERRRGRSTQTLIREAIKAETGDDPELFLKRLVRLAITTGDAAFWRILMDRWLPPPKSEDPLVKVDLPSGVPLGEKGIAVFAAIASGEITPAQGATMIGALSNIAKIIEFTEFEKRLVALEHAAHKDESPPLLEGDTPPTEGAT